MSCVPLADLIATCEYALPPPNEYAPFGAVPKIVESRFTRISVPHFIVCRPRTPVISNLSWYRFPYDPKIEPAGPPYASNKPSPNRIPGCVWFSAGKFGVLRTYPSDACKLRCGLMVRAYVTPALR